MFHHCDSPSSEKNCENATFSEESFLRGEELTEMATLLSLLTTFLHSLHAVDSVDLHAFSSATTAFTQFDTVYTQLCMYSLLQSNHHVRNASLSHTQTAFPVSPALAEDAFFILRESARRQVLVSQPISLPFSFLLTYLTAETRAPPNPAPATSPASWLHVDDRLLVAFDG